MTAENTTKLDLRAIPVFERHPAIFEAWEGLEGGQILQIINDHDPKPLRYQFEAEHKDSYKWEYLEEGPQWVVNITKIAPPPATGEALKAKVLSALDQVRPFLQADGGDVELVEIDEAARTAYVKLTGACGGCPSAGLTLKAGVQDAVRKIAPEIKTVEAVH